MKTYIIILTCLILGSCKKESGVQQDFAPVELGGPTELINTSRGSDNNFYQVGVHNFNFGLPYPSQGLRAKVDVKKLQLGNAKVKAFWIAFYYYTPEGRQRWIQLGYAYNKTGLIPFMYVWDIQNWGQVSLIPGIDIHEFANTPLAYNTKVEFAIQNNPGTTWWTCSRNSRPVLEVNLGTDHSDGLLQAYTESVGDASFGPELNIDYFQVFREGAWLDVPNGRANSTRYWNIQGVNQRPEFGPTQMVMGGRVRESSFPFWWILFGTDY
jgi:hypothetical protein